jgi:hypothetical protein
MPVQINCGGTVERAQYLKFTFHDINIISWKPALRLSEAQLDAFQQAVDNDHTFVPEKLELVCERHDVVLSSVTSGLALLFPYIVSQLLRDRANAVRVRS